MHEQTRLCGQPGGQEIARTSFLRFGCRSRLARLRNLLRTSARKSGTGIEPRIRTVRQLAVAPVTGGWDPPGRLVSWRRRLTPATQWAPAAHTSGGAHARLSGLARSRNRARVSAAVKAVRFARRKKRALLASPPMRRARDLRRFAASRFSLRPDAQSLWRFVARASRARIRRRRRSSPRTESVFAHHLLRSSGAISDARSFAVLGVRPDAQSS